MNNSKQNNKKKPPIPEQLDYKYINDLKNVFISPSLALNEQYVKELFRDCSDFVIRPFTIEKDIPALAIFVDGLVSTHPLEDALSSLVISERGDAVVQHIIDTRLPVTQITDADNYGDLLLAVLSGDTAVFIEGNMKAALIGLRGAPARSIAEPETEAVIRGPREGFVENLRTNTAMVRKRLKTPRLKMKPMVIGRHSNTNVAVAYMEDLTDPALVDEVLQRLQKIKIDAVLESGVIEELIQDSAYSPFPQIQYTERPDVVAAAILEGRIAIMIDGTPFTLLVPTVFVQLLQAPEDYYERFQMSTFLRWLRYVFLFMSLFTPALYIAVTTYHAEMFPTTLLLSIAAAREAIPFPAVVEALLMEVIFEALREASIRLPKAIGSAVSILGALVIGQSAVQAGIVSAPMVIVVAITGIASFTIPRFNAAIAIRILRFPLMMIAAVFGMYGVMIGGMLIVGHMAKLRSFGVPYLSPVGPLNFGDLKDVLIRAPHWAMRTRPSFLGVQDETRQGENLPDEISAHSGQKGHEIRHKHAADAGKESEKEGGSDDGKTQKKD